MAQNLFKFNTESDYRTAKRHNLIVPNVCMVSESGNTYVNGTMASKSEAEAGDIIAFDINNKMYFIKPEAFSGAICDTYTPVAIVVVPSSHNVDGKVTGMSLATMSPTNPTVGTTENNEIISWGSPVLGVAGYDGVVTLSLDDVTNSNATIYASELSHLPSDNFFDTISGVDNIIDTYTKWVGDVDTHTPSPYLKNGNKSTLYSTDSLTMNALQQVDGRANKPTVINENDNPAFYACDSFAVGAYKSGHLWYLPSIAELGYLMVRLGRIKYALKQVADNNTSRFAVAEFDTTQTYWSSTQSGSQTKAWYLDPARGEISKMNTNSTMLVRAFAKF